jgi:hypothetical protein
MSPKSFHILVTIAAFAVSAQAQNVTGTILIKRRLTRQSVTPIIPADFFIPIDFDIQPDTPVKSAGTGGR